RWQLGDEPVAPAQESVRLIAVDVKDAVPRPATSAGALEIGLGDLAIRVDAGTDVTYVAALVNALRSRC
ncbi:MAG TPA: hypothetical protein VL400_17130, partial [Polyangiaceae bacterium]|nr:hypothetical protein [Polyangiaceae bacterium]